VTRSYVFNLCKGPIENPGYAKLAAMAKAMGFAPELWFEQGATRVPDGRSDDSRGIAGRVEYLFDALRNPKTGKPYTNAEVARMMLGDLSKEDIEGNRGGAIGDPSVGQIRALAGVFGVEPCKLIKALPDGTLREAALEISLSVRARQATGVGDRAAVQNAGRCYRSIDPRGSEGAA
jgi:hypothetical protein